MVDYFEHARRMDSIRAAEAAGEVADSMEVRMALIERMRSGELTLEQVQVELKRIKRQARAKGQTTRSRLYSGRS